MLRVDMGRVDAENISAAQTGMVMGLTQKVGEMAGGLRIDVYVDLLLRLCLVHFHPETENTSNQLWKMFKESKLEWNPYFILLIIAIVVQTATPRARSKVIASCSSCSACCARIESSRSPRVPANPL